MILLIAFLFTTSPAFAANDCDPILGTAANLRHLDDFYSRIGSSLQISRPSVEGLGREPVAVDGALRQAGFVLSQRKISVLNEERKESSIEFIYKRSSPALGVQEVHYKIFGHGPDPRAPTISGMNVESFGLEEENLGPESSARRVIDARDDITNWAVYLTGVRDVLVIPEVLNDPNVLSVGFGDPDQWADIEIRLKPESGRPERDILLHKVAGTSISGRDLPPSEQMEVGVDRRKFLVVITRVGDREWRWSINRRTGESRPLEFDQVYKIWR